MLDIVPPHGGYEQLDHSETLAAWLQRSGHATVLLGKYLNGYGRRDPAEVPAGWGEWHGLVDPTTNRYYDYTFNDDGVLRRYGFDPADYQTDVITGRAEEIIARRSAAADPFFLWVSYLAPHHGAPREARDPWEEATPVAAPRHTGRFAFEGVERIVGALERAGELQDTLLVFTSDNGFLHGEHRVPTGKVLPTSPRSACRC